MQQKTNLHQEFQNILKLSPQLKQHLFFILSNVLYHSYDYFLSAFLNTKSTSQTVFTLFGLLDVHLIQIVLNLVWLALDFIIIVLIFIEKKKLYLIQIVDKIIFPFQVLILALCYNDSSSDFTYASKQWKISLKILFTLSTTVTLIIILTKNFWLNLRYKQNLQKGLNRLFRLQIIILVLKILTSFVLRTFIKAKTEIPNLIILSVLNIALNVFFRTKIFYEHPNIEYLAFITQFYLWIPIVCGVLQQFSYELESISIFFCLCTLLYFFLGILKPKVFLNFIESKYLKKIKEFQDIIKSYSKRENIRLNGKQQQVISYLSMSLTLYANLHMYCLKFSQYFKTEVFKIVKQTTQILSSTANFKRNLSQTTQNYQHNPCSTLLNPNPRFKTVKKGLKHHLYSKHQQNTYLSDKDFFNQICRSTNQFLFDVEQCSSQVRLWICYNFADSSNKMIHHSFYSYFLNLNSQKNIFEEIDNSICYSYLLQKVGRQKSYRTYKNDQTYFQVGSNVVEKTQKFIKDNFLNNQFCLFEEAAYFTSEFNAVVVQNSISSQIIYQLNQFLKNQQLYIDLHTSFHQQKSRIFQYFFNRNKLRLILQEKIQAYSQLKKGQKKFYLQLIFNYIKDFWLKQDPLVAYENFVLSLQNATKNRIHQNVNELCIEIDQRNRQRNITCILSGINDFDTILISCPEFKRLLELQKDNFPNSLYSSNRQNDSTNKYDENYHKVKLNTLMLPLWRQQHQKVISNNLFQRPIHHLDKKYFLLSKKQRSVLEVRLRMSFHMLYQKDLLIILDISHQKIISIEIFDKENKTILFSHRKSEQTSKCSIYSESGTRNKLNSLIDNQIKQRIYEANKTYLNDKRQRILALQQITVFNQAYNIVIKKEQKHSTAIFQGVIDFKAKSLINFEQVCLEEQKHAFQRENKLKELKFYKQKQRFSIFGKKLHLFALTYLVSCLISIIIFREYKVNQQNMLVQLINVLDDEILLEDRYIKNEFSKTTGIGMFSNMYLKQLNVALLKTKDRLALFEHVTTSVKDLLIQIKTRHADNISTIHKGMRSQKFYNPKWITGSTTSFEMGVFWSQFVYLQCLKNFAKIVETRTISNTTNTVIRDFQIILNLPKVPFSNFQVSKNIKFIQRLMYNKNSIFNPENGVFGIGQRAQKELFYRIKSRQLQQIIIFEFLIGVISISMVIALLFLVKKIIDKYEISVCTSDKFLILFTKNRQKLLKCLEELNRFSKETIFRIVKPRKIDYKELKEKKFYTVTSISQQKAVQTKAIQKLKSNMTHQHKHMPIHKKSNNKQSFKNLISLYFSYMIFPCIRYIMLVLISLSVFWKSSTSISSLQIYGKGLSSMTYVNMQLINLFGTNLFLTNFRTYAQMFNNSYTISDLKKQFTEVIALVSNIDKMQIVNQLFLDNYQNKQYIQSILYQNICQQYSNYIECPPYMVPYMTGMYEKYGELIKNLNILNRHLINSQVSKLGTINTTQFQYLYIDSFQNLQQLLVISKGLKNLSFSRLQQILSISPEGQYINGTEKLLMYLLISLYFLMDSFFLIRKLFSEEQILKTQFLRVGNFEMYSSEKFMMKGYHAFVNKAQEEQWAAINE